MRWTSIRVPAVSLVLAMNAGVASADLIPVDFSGQFNMPLNAAFLANGGTFPTGPQVLGGVPFNMGGSSNLDTPWAWNAQFAPDAPNAPGARVLNIPVNQFGVTDAYTLINTYWGTPGPVSYLSVTFIGISNVQEFKLYGNEDIRDYNQWVWTNTINGTTSVEVFNNGIGQRIDRQHYVLSPGFATDTLLSVLIVDTGAETFQRGFIAGLTVNVPTPAGAGLLALGAFGWSRRRR
jgi:hypothetical protein